MVLSNQAMTLSINMSTNPNDASHHDQIVTSSNKVSVSRKSRKKIVGVTKRTSGKYAVKVYDRLRKKDLCLGTFDTAEEASNVYLSKKKELEEEFQQRVIGAGKRTSKYVGVWKRDSGKFAAHIRDPIRKKKLYLGAFESEEEAAEAYLAKKAELEEEVKGKGIRWTSKRECRKSMCSEIMENVDESGQCIEENNSDRCLEFNQESSKEIDNSDSCNGGSASRNVSLEENLPTLEDNNGNLLLDKQGSSKEADDSCSYHTESASMDSGVSRKNLPIEENGEKEFIVVDSSVQSRVNPGAKILLRTKSGSPLMDSNGILLGDWSWIDDLSLSIRM